MCLATIFCANYSLIQSWEPSNFEILTKYQPIVGDLDCLARSPHISYYCHFQSSKDIGSFVSALLRIGVSGVYVHVLRPDTYWYGLSVAWKDRWMTKYSPRAFIFAPRGNIAHCHIFMRGFRVRADNVFSKTTVCSGKLTSVPLGLPACGEYHSARWIDV